MPSSLFSPKLLLLKLEVENAMFGLAITRIVLL